RREHVEEVARFRRPVEDRLEERLAAVLDGRSRVGDDENAERRSGDDDELVGLEQHLEMAAERRIAAEDASDGDDEADAEIQDSLPGAERSAKLCRSRLTRGCQRRGQPETSRRNHVWAERPARVQAPADERHAERTL